jgi:hypothetical protein
MSIDWMAELYRLGLAAVVCGVSACLGCAAVALYFRLRDRRTKGGGADREP